MQKIPFLYEENLNASSTYFDEETYHLWTEKSSYRKKQQRMIMYKSKKGRMFLGSFKNYSFMLYVDGWLEWLDSRKLGNCHQWIECSLSSSAESGFFWKESNYSCVYTFNLIMIICDTGVMICGELENLTWS